MNISVGPELSDDLKELLQSLPRCIYGASSGLHSRCNRIGLYVRVNPDGTRDYGAQLCREHKSYFESKQLNMRFAYLSYAPAAERLAKKFNILLMTDVALRGVREEKS
jgi:hypothetical protein